MDSSIIPFFFFYWLTEEAVPDKDEHTPGVDIEPVDTERGEVLTNTIQGLVDAERYQTNKYEVECSTQCCDVVLTLQSKKYSDDFMRI